jgi:hypothetical protein
MPSSNLALFIDKAALYKNIIEYTLIGFGVALLLIGIFGAIGTAKRSKCCLCVFEIGAIILSILFLGGGFLSTELSTKVFDKGTIGL